MSSPHVWWRRALRDESGSIALLFAGSIFFVILSIGLAIDGARAYNVSSRIVSALDASALAAAKLLDSEDTTNAEIEDRARNFFAAHFTDVPVTGLTLAAPAVTIDRETGDVSLSVDVKLATTFAQLAGVSEWNFPKSVRVRYNQKKIELGVVLDITGSMCQPCTKIAGLKSATRTLVDNIITPKTPYGFVRVGLAPYSATVNAGSFAAAVSGGASTDGCVVERQGAQNDTDMAPGSGDPLGTATRFQNSRYTCPSSPILPLTADPNVLKSQIDSLSTGGYTAGHIGLAWGWYLVSHKWKDIWPEQSEPKAPSDKVIKAVLLMTDGEFNTSYIPGSGKNSTSISVANSSPEQTARLCTSMKSEGVIVYAVAFEAPSQARNLLSGCATSASHYFTANNSTELVSAFRTIAERLSALRVTH